MAALGQDLLANLTVEIGIVPVADAYAGTVSTDVISMENYTHGGFLICQGAIEDTGVSNVVTVEACDDTTPSNTSAIAFRHRTKNSTNAWGALTAAASTGYNFNLNNTNANAVYWVEFTAAEVAAANSNAGYGYVRLKVTETANKTVTAGIYFIGWNSRYPGALPVEALT